MEGYRTKFERINVYNAATNIKRTRSVMYKKYGKFSTLSSKK